LKKEKSEPGTNGWKLRRPIDLPGKWKYFTAMNAIEKLPDVFAQDREVMSGAVVFRGTRIPAQTFFDHLDHGGTVDQFLEWYDGVTREQLESALKIRSSPNPAH
jgi:uncharacterized protein (DUF433 family)